MGNGKTPVAHSLQEAKIGSFEGDEALHQRIDRRRDLRQGILSGRLAQPHGIKRAFNDGVELGPSHHAAFGRQTVAVGGGSRPYARSFRDQPTWTAARRRHTTPA